MKFVILILVYIGLCHTKDEQLCIGQNLMEVLKRCLEISGAKDEAIFNLRQKLKANSDEEQCFRACALQECNIMDDFGNLDFTSTKPYIKYLTSDKNKQIRSNEIILECVKNTKNDGDICNTAEIYINCGYECKDCGWDLFNI